MALTVTSRGTGTHNTGATTLVPGGRTATLAVGSMGVLCIALDNAGSAGSAIIAPTSWTDAKSNVWTRRTSRLYDNGAASAGIEMVFYTAPITTALLTTDLGTITWNPSASPVAKVWTWYEVIPSGANTVGYSTGGDIAGATAANAQVTTGSVVVGDAVIAGYFSENVNAVTGDSDTTNGTWTAQQTTTVGSGTSGVRIATQQKVQTTTPSTQSYDVTVASQDRIAGYIMLHEVVDTTLTPGVLATATTKFAPTATATTNQTLTPPVVATTTATFVPTATKTENQTLTPPVVATTTATFVPTATISGSVVLTPPVVETTTATFVPTVAATENWLLTPPVVATATETFVPTAMISGSAVLTPPAVATATETFVPTVVASAHQTLTPGAVATTTTGFAPTTNLTVIPGEFKLEFEGFEPEVLTQLRIIVPKVGKMVEYRPAYLSRWLA